MSRTQRITALLLVLILPILAACGGSGGASPSASGGTSGSASASPSTAASASPSTAASASPSTSASSSASASPRTSASASPSGSASASASTGGAATATADETAVTGVGAPADETAIVGAGAPADETATVAAGAPTEIDLSAIPVEQGARLRFAAAGNTTEQQLYQSGADRFNELFADQDVQITFEPVPAEYETTVTAAFAGGNAPDVFLVNGPLMSQLGTQGQLLALDSAMEQAGRSADDFYPQLIELYQFNNQTYGLPKDFNPLVLFVNTQIAQEAGVDPASITSWDTLRSAAEAMTEGEGAGGRRGLCFAPDIERFGAFMLQNGNPIIENNQAVFNQPSGVEAITFFRDLQQAGFADTFQGLGGGWCGEVFAQQAAAMTIEGGWMVPFLADPANGAQDLQYTAVVLPTPPNGEQSSLLFTNAFGANAATQYPNAAAAAVLFLTSEQNQQALIESGLAQPSLQSLANDPYYTTNEVASVLVEGAQGGRVSETTFGGVQNKADVVRILNQTAIEQVFVGGADPQQALDQAAQEVNNTLQQ